MLWATTLISRLTLHGTLLDLLKRQPALTTFLAQSDYITIHVPALPSTIGMFNSEAFAKMKKGARLLNFSRDTLVDTTDIQAALEDGTVSCYVTDFATADLLNNDKGYLHAASRRFYS